MLYFTSSLIKRNVQIFQFFSKDESGQCELWRNMICRSLVLDGASGCTVCVQCVITVSSCISGFSSPAAEHFGALPRMNRSCLLTALTNIQRQWLVSAPAVCPRGMLNLGWSQLGLPKWWMTTLQPSVPCPWRAVYPQRSPQMDFMAANSVSVRLCRPAIHQVESAGKFHRLLACHLVRADMWVISAAYRISLREWSFRPWPQCQQADYSPADEQFICLTVFL